MERERLPRQFTGDTDMWVDEAIWGHRLYDEQTPWLTFLEFLGVLAAEHQEGRAFKEVGGSNSLAYKPKQLLHLRNVVFNNPQLTSIAAEFPDDDQRWTEWERVMERERERQKGKLRFGFSYVRRNFGSFADFVAVVELLQAGAIEGDSNKQFTSKFLFPYGPDCLFEDLDVRSYSRGRRFFARTGEIAYLMFCRSSKGDELLPRLEKVVLEPDKPMNRMVRALHSFEEEDLHIPKPPYLPYSDLPDYQWLAEDWLALLSCRMPDYDVVPHLVNILALNLLLYFLRRAQEQIDGSNKVTLICEIMAPRKTVIRELAAESYGANNLRSREALDANLKAAFSTPEWSATATAADPVDEALQFLAKHFSWEPEETHANPQALSEAFRKAVMVRHSAHGSKIHAAWSRALGLASRRGTRRVRYCPTDALLKTLVFTVTGRRMEFQQFLARLYERYRLVIGHHQAPDLIQAGSADQKHFEENARRLEMRLGSLGLLRRLSDACAYVVNPFAEEST